MASRFMSNVQCRSSHKAKHFLTLGRATSSSSSNWILELWFLVVRGRISSSSFGNDTRRTVSHYKAKWSTTARCTSLISPEEQRLMFLRFSVLGDEGHYYFRRTCADASSPLTYCDLRGWIFVQEMPYALLLYNSYTTTSTTVWLIRVLEGSFCAGLRSAQCSLMLEYSLGVLYAFKSFLNFYQHSQSALSLLSSHWECIQPHYEEHHHISNQKRQAAELIFFADRYYLFCACDTVLLRVSTVVRCTSSNVKAHWF